MIKGKNVFINYYQNNELYKEVVKDSWFYTGDICEFRDNKYWYLDRKKDLIIKSGINILPAEIEEVIHSVDGVIECAVVPVYDEGHGEKILAVVVAVNAIKQDDLRKKIILACKSKLSNYKLPSDIVFWKKLPKTPSKKISRKKIREHLNLFS